MHKVWKNVFPFNTEIPYQDYVNIVMHWERFLCLCLDGKLKKNISIKSLTLILCILIRSLGLTWVKLM